MNWSNPNKAWDVLVSRKAERKENRPAFIAALLMDRCNNALPKGGDVQPLSPSMAAAFAAEFVRLAHSIKGLAEADCNYGLSPAQETRSENLQKRFAELATALGFEARTGGDPRGACAYLIDPADRKGDGWGEGWAVYA